MQRTARLARELGCAHVGQVLPACEPDRTAPEFFDSAERSGRRLFGGSGETGWLVEVWPGKGCETAVFGLVRRRPRRPGEWHRTFRPRRNSRWELAAFCKTCYAAEHGLDHFIRCHERVVRLLDLWGRSAVRVRVHDEGRFWKTRSHTALAAELGDHERFLQVAGNRVWS